MNQEPDPGELLGRTGSEELLGGDEGLLPESIGRPPPIPPSRTRRKLVAVGATLTGVTLFGGIALIVLGAIQAVSGGFGAFALVAVILGIVLVSTHWGWVHVAEFTTNVVDSRRNREIEAQRHGWLERIEPYTRYEVTTHVEPDGSLTIATVRHRPVRTGEGRFKFVRDVLDPEHHSDEEPAAVIAERAEHLRRQAALMTERERTRYQAAVEDHQHALLGQRDDEEQLRARRAASEALAEQINTNLRDPPLTE